MGDLPQPTLSISHTRQADAHLIKLVGEMDLSNVGDARKAVLSAIYSSDVKVIVDLSELEFIDSTGISMLLEVQKASRMDSDCLWFRGAHAEVARILELTRVDEQLRFSD